MPSDSSLVDHGDDEIRFRKGANWISDNVKTLMQWIHISAIYIDILGESIKHYKRILRTSVILNLILSSIASTVSISQYSDVTTRYPALDWCIKAGFTLSTIVIALNAGYLKVYNIQEKVEKGIRLQQQWIEFGTTLSSELQLPVEHRKDALFFIIRMKDVYAGLIKQHIVANRAILKKIALKNGVSADVLTLSDLLERSIQSEAVRIEGLEPNRRVRKTESFLQLPADSVQIPVSGKKPIENETKAPFVPSPLSLQLARHRLRRAPLAPPTPIVMSQRKRISSYVLEPSVVRTEGLGSIPERDGESQDTESVHSTQSYTDARAAPTQPTIEV